MEPGGGLLILICLCHHSQSSPQSKQEVLKGRVPLGPFTPDPATELDKQKEILLVSAADIIHGTNPMVWGTAEIRMRADQCASFEIGFVFKTIEDTYKRMLDIYNSSMHMRFQKGGGEGNVMTHVNNLGKIEKFHWRIYHLHNMMHEIERKYKMDTVINGSGMFEDGKRWTRMRTTVKHKTWKFTWPRRTTSWWRPLDYGWNNDYYIWK